MERRDFFKIVVGGISFLAFKSGTSHIPITPEPPATTLLGQELVRPLLPPGWYKVKLIDVDVKESRLTGEPNFWFSFETTQEPKTVITQIVGSRAPWEIIKIADKAGAMQVHDSIDLTSIIGREIDVEIKHQEFKGRTFMSVRQ